MPKGGGGKGGTGFKSTVPMGGKTSQPAVGRPASKGQDKSVFKEGGRKGA